MCWYYVKISIWIFLRKRDRRVAYVFWCPQEFPKCTPCMLHIFYFKLFVSYHRISLYFHCLHKFGIPNYFNCRKAYLSSSSLQTASGLSSTEAAGKILWRIRGFISARKCKIHGELFLSEAGLIYISFP